MHWFSTVVRKRLLFIPVLVLALVTGGLDIHGEQKEPPKETELAGHWVIVSVVQGGTAVQDAPGTKVVIEGEKFKVVGEFDKLKFRLDPTKKPKHIDFMEPNVKDSVKGIYLMEGDVLRICVDRGDKDRPSARPTEFASKAGTQIGLMILKREKK